ncbi:MAG TPA: transposase [Gemmatimonadetes bacterium]|nr:transposase [Gemmatimonadota bacterium]
MGRRNPEARRALPRRPGWRDVSDDFWDKIARFIPKPKRRTKKGGRLPAEPRKLLDGMLYVLRTGCQWKMLPREYYAGSTTHKYFQLWARRGVFRKTWRQCLKEYDELKGVDWKWQILDSQTVQSPVKGGKNRQEPHGSGKVRHKAPHPG